MATTYNHAQIGIVDASGNVNVIYPITTGSDVSITRTNTKLPTAATTAQALANAFGKLAFADSEISDSETSTTKTWSSNKINTAITELNSKMNGKSNTNHTHDDRYYTESEMNIKLGNISTYVGSDGKLHFKNSAGADTVLNFNNVKFGTYNYNTTANPEIYLGFKPNNLVICECGKNSSKTQAERWGYIGCVFKDCIKNGFPLNGTATSNITFSNTGSPAYTITETGFIRKGTLGRDTYNFYFATP